MGNIILVEKSSDIVIVKLNYNDGSTIKDNEALYQNLKNLS